MGSKQLGLRVLERVAREPNCELVGVLCAADELDPRSQLSAFESRARAAAWPIAVEQRAGEVGALLQTWSPELVVVAGWYHRVPVELLPDVMVVGFHASPLPRYRGGAPLTWQIIEGEPEIGLSLFHLVSGMDAGPIVAQAKTPFGPDATIGDALGWAESACVELLDAHLPALLRRSAPMHEQDHTGATWCAQRRPEDGAIDWRWSARRVHDFVRAQTRPYPGAFTALPSGDRLTIWRTAREARPYLGSPGSVAERAEGAALVACGEGAIWVMEVQREGSPPETGRSVLSSISLRLS